MIRTEVRYSQPGSPVAGEAVFLCPAGSLEVFHLILSVMNDKETYDNNMEL